MCLSNKIRDTIYLQINKNSTKLKYFTKIFRAVHRGLHRNLPVVATHKPWKSVTGIVFVPHSSHLFIQLPALV